MKKNFNLFNEKKLFKLIIIFTFNLLVVEPCFAKKINFESCAYNLDPPRCFVETAHRLTRTKADEDYKSILVLGAIDWIKPKHHKLLKNVRESFNESDNFLKSFGIEFIGEDSKETEIIKKDKILIAALALAAAAQNFSNPFDDAIVKRYLEKAHNDYAVSMLALSLWSDFDTYSVWRSSTTQPVGIPSILTRIINAPQLDAHSLSNLIWDWSDTGSLEFIAHQKINSLILASSNQGKAELASRLARIYFNVEDSERLMMEGGSSAENYNIDGIYLEIAIAKLHKKYDAISAKLLLQYALSEEEIKTASYKNRMEDIPDALEKGMAINELKQLANGYLEAAENISFRPEHRGDLYALASECFLREKDKKSAILVAKKGLSQIPSAVKWRAPRIKKPDLATPTDLSRSAHGWGTDPVVALYRAGAIDDAVATGYLNGYARYRYAKDAGETPESIWWIDYSWHSKDDAESLGRDLLYLSVEQRSSLYQVAEKWLETHQWAWKNLEVQTDLAQLAASTYNKSAMQTHLKAYARQLDKEPDKGDAAYFALALAEQWKRNTRIIENSKI